MPIQDEEKASGKLAAKAIPILKFSNKWLGLYSYWTETMNWHWNTGIQWTLLFFKCQSKFITRLVDTVKKSIEKKMEESIMTKLLMNARKTIRQYRIFGQTIWRSPSSMLSIGRKKNGYQFWQKVEDKRKGYNIAWIRTIVIISCTFEQSKDIEEVQSILHWKTKYCYQKGLPSISSLLWIRWIIKMA